ncbi:Serine/threonine-protein kinase StkP [Rubripirellula tenax]|uniref:Serine/threonine-protein kinase StkP n=1 Tax=Rubripirellula tenax TaxID=2528015 RepID=A0A5C6FD79_9BACT|nr:serine/threonine-protein kinase [Rubripirellula tenax]TWU59375.1 Serine/threonine-protein kinase StkP [Rubripirellula tenax]
MNTAKPKYDFLDPPTRDDEIGRLGPYRIVGLLGQGGMGEVFRAEDGRLKRTVALKMMNKKLAGTSNSRKRFVEEARSMAAVHHDNVATIFEVGLQRGMPYLAMELLKGESLFDRIKSKPKDHRKFSYPEVIRIAREVSCGLAAAHACAIIHRDIKPANIWMEEPSGRAKILDFGLAVAGSDHLTGRGSVVGSPGYLSPEQARNEPVDDRTDLYALGVVLYQLCGGRLPLRSASMSGQLIAILCHAPAPLRTVAPEIPEPFCELVDRLLSKEARDRPKSALALVDLVDDIERNFHGEMQAATQIVVEPAAPSGSKPTRRAEETHAVSNRKSPVPWWVLSIAGLLLLLIAGWTMRPKRTASKPVQPTRERESKPVSRPVVITAASLAKLELSPVVAGSDEVTAGEVSRFKMRLSNQALDDSDDPRAINAKASLVANVVTFLTPAGQKKRRAPTFPRKFSPTQLPRPGESQEFEIQVMTKGLPAGDYDVEFELQTPGGTVVGKSNSRFSVDENLLDSDLLGFEIVRTHSGRGADTYVSSTSDEAFGGRHALQAVRFAGDKGEVKEHIYFRFDLAATKIDRKSIDRAVLMLTLGGESNTGKNEFGVYGIVEGLGPLWKETGVGHLVFQQSPLRSGTMGQTFLGTLQFINPVDQLNDMPDHIKMAGEALDTFLRTSESDLVTIALVRQNWSEKRTYFRSKEGSLGKAPAIAIRVKNP